jgi:hypothetical protein
LLLLLLLLHTNTQVQVFHNSQYQVVGTRVNTQVQVFHNSQYHVVGTVPPTTNCLQGVLGFGAAVRFTPCLDHHTPLYV